MNEHDTSNKSTSEVCSCCHSHGHGHHESSARPGSGRRALAIVLWTFVIAGVIAALIRALSVGG